MKTSVDPGADGAGLWCNDGGVNHVLAASEAPDPSSLPGMGNGLLGLIVTAGLVVAIIVLYRSMRTQMKKIDFDAEGTTDEERMRGAKSRSEDEPDDESSGRDERPADSHVNGHHERPPQV